MPILPANEALNRLREGNRRFVAGESRQGDHRGRRAELVDGQAPFAVVLACADSRESVELIFDQGLGDLFVNRIAGNLVTPTMSGSVEFAAELLGTRLAVVLGHSGCGAIKATVDALEGSAGSVSPNLDAIVEEVRPSVAPLLADEGSSGSREALIARAVRDNVRASVRQLREGSALLGRLYREEGLAIVGAEYDLASGNVDFFDGLP